MNILHLVSNYFPAVGGPQYIIKHLSERLVSMYGDNVEVLTSDSFYGPGMYLFKRIRPDEGIINGVYVKRHSFIRWHYSIIDFLNKIWGKLFKKALPFKIKKLKNGLHSPSLIKSLNSAEADVVMATTVEFNYCDYPFWREKTKNPKPFVLYGALHLHINWKRDSPFIKRVLASDIYIANTEFERQEVIKFGKAPSTVVTIGIGINAEEYDVDSLIVSNFRKLNNIQPDDILVGHIGRLSEGKGVKILLEAFELIYRANKKVKLLLAGSETNYVAEIKNIISSKKLPVILIADFEEDAKYILFNAIDIFVLASKGESFGVVFLEAWACKKPVIGTKMGAIESVIEDSGLLFNYNDRNDLAGCINKLINSEETRILLGEKGYLKIREKYSWPVIVSKYRSAYIMAIEQFNNKTSSKHY